MPEPSVSIEPLQYRAGEVKLSGFVARGDGPVGARPGVVVVHDAWGVGENVKMRARMLAELGFVALVADLYGDGNAPRVVDDARAKVGYFKSNIDVLRRRIIAALEALTAQADVDGARLAAIGYCFGGTTVLELARAGADCAAPRRRAGARARRCSEALPRREPQMLARRLPPQSFVTSVT